MSTTKELVQAFNKKNPPIQIQTVSVRQFELIDPDDPESDLREIVPKNVPTTYCWRFDVANVSYWISQGNYVKMLDALKPEMVPEPGSQELISEDLGSIVGTRAKVGMDGKTLHYGPVELYVKQWQRLQDAGILIN